MSSRTRVLTTALLVTGFVAACHDAPTSSEPVDPGIEAAKGGNGKGGGGNDPVPITLASTGGMVAAAQPGVINSESNNNISLTAGAFNPCRDSGIDCYISTLQLTSIVDTAQCISDSESARAANMALLDDPEQGRFHLGVAIGTRTNPSTRGNQINLYWDDDVQQRRVDMLVTTSKQLFPGNRLTVERTITGDIETFEFTNGSIWFPGGSVGSMTCPFTPTGSLTLTMDRTP